jgi:aminoglycoside phosphotransferase family enzyme/predicted kinase
MIQEAELIQHLEKPRVYPEASDKVRIKQTYISIICLTGKYAYKFKKPVNYGYLDYTTLEKRKFFCEEEVRLNRRFSPDLYVGVVSLTYERDADTLALEGNGEIIDYAVKMKEVPQQFIMTERIKQGDIDTHTIREIIRNILPVYRDAPRNERIASYGHMSNIRRNTDENFQQTESMVGNTISKEDFVFIQRQTEQFYEKNSWLFEKRVTERRIVEGHGDLRPGNIFITDKILVFDCIEFNERFRCLDLAEDIAFLAMELDFLNQCSLSAQFIRWFALAADDIDLLRLVTFYKCYRAYVRGKVLSFSLEDETLAQEDKKKAHTNAIAYFHLSRGYAGNLLNRYMAFDLPLLIIMSGLSGEGKSYIAKSLQDMFEARLFRSDEVRQELFGSSDLSDRRVRYSQLNRHRVYRELFQRAEASLRSGISCILDATFGDKELRIQAREIAQRVPTHFLIVRPAATEETVRCRLHNRARDQNEPSEATWDVYCRQKETFDPYDSAERKCLITIDGNAPLSFEEAFDKIFRRLHEHIIL